MRYLYDNTGSPYYSEATRIFESSMDWTANGIKALALWFHGEPDNAAERLYLRITDGNTPRGEATIVYEDSNDLIQGPKDGWNEWNIVLSELSSAVDLTDINGITIGFGDGSSPGGEGYVYFDNLLLYPPRCARGYSYGFGDISGDCSVDYKDVELMGRDWLIRDYNTIGYPGTLIGFDDPDGAWSEETADGNGSLYFPAIEDGNGDLYCDGASDHSPAAYSHVETVPLGITSNTITMTAWIKMDGLQCTWSSGIVFMRPPATGMNIFGDELRYHWNDTHWSWNPGLHVPNETWTFVALVVSPDGARLYMNEIFANDSTGAGWDPVEFAEPIWLGQDWVRATETRNFRGWIDDVRIYDFSLDESEIEYVRTFGSFGTPPAAGPISWYKIDETSGIKVADSCGEIVYWPITSKANFTDPEPQYQRAVNFRDYCVIADSWLEELLFPPE
jgi:hypothetical protein